jgi:hypothetical protein
VRKATFVRLPWNFDSRELNTGENANTQESSQSVAETSCEFEAAPRFAARQCKSGEPIQRSFHLIRSPVDDSLGWVSEPSPAGLGLPIIFAFGPMELAGQQQQQQTLEEENEISLLQKPMRAT